MDAGTYYVVLGGEGGDLPWWPLYVAIGLTVLMCVLPFIVKTKEKEDE